MTAFFLWLSLGLCPYDAKDDELTMKLCEALFNAKHRIITVKNPYDEFDRVYFNWQVNKAVGRR